MQLRDQPASGQLEPASRGGHRPKAVRESPHQEAEFRRSRRNGHERRCAVHGSWSLCLNIVNKPLVFAKKRQS